MLLALQSLSPKRSVVLKGWGAAVRGPCEQLVVNRFRTKSVCCCVQRDPHLLPQQVQPQARPRDLPVRPHDPPVRPRDQRAKRLDLRAAPTVRIVFPAVWLTLCYRFPSRTLRPVMLDVMPHLFVTFTWLLRRAASGSPSAAIFLVADLYSNARWRTPYLWHWGHCWMLKHGAFARLCCGSGAASAKCCLCAGATSATTTTATLSESAGPRSALTT